MFQEMFSDWRFWAVVGSAALVLAETRWTVQRHKKILNGGSNPGKDLSTLVALTVQRVDGIVEDIRAIREEIKEERRARDVSMKRLWDKFEGSG